MEKIQEIYRQYYSPLLRFAEDMVGNREDAENILQDSFLNIINKKEELSKVQNVRAWLYQMIRNGCLDHLKHMVHVHKYEQEAAIEFKLRSTALRRVPEEEVIFNELQGKIKMLIAELPDRCREVFLLNRLERLKYSEIAERLGISENTVSVHMSTAVKRLRIGLTQYLN